MFETFAIADSIVLKEGFLKFRELIFDNFKVDIVSVLTISTLAIKIYFTQFYKNETLFTVDEKADKYMRMSYFGGKTEVFKPYAKTCYTYDTNSLYSHVMKNNKFSTGIHRFVKEGDITEEIKTKKGFFKVIVVAPENLKYPFLVYKNKDSENEYESKPDDPGLISPVGEWTGVYFSEEINYAKELGYTFKYIDGYIYQEEDYIFHDFVDTIYDMRLNYKKGTGLNKISKLLLNSLYGKFGTNTNNDDTEIVTTNSYKHLNIIKNHTLLNEIVINNMTIIKYLKKNKNPYYELYLAKQISYDYYLALVGDPKVLPLYQKKNVAVSSAITAYARIYMDRVMRKVGFENIFYTDTDSIFSSVPLDDSIVSDTFLGKFKFEGIIKEAIFLGPKMYAYKKDSGIEEKVVATGFERNGFTHEDYKKRYFENIELECKEENPFSRDFYKFEIMTTTTIKNYKNEFNKRTKIFNQNGLWIDTTPLILKHKKNDEI